MLDYSTLIVENDTVSLEIARSAIFDCSFSERILREKLSFLLATTVH